VSDIAALPLGSDPGDAAVTGPACSTATTRAGAAPSGSFGPASGVLGLRMSGLDLRPLPAAVPSARLHTRHVVCEWGFPGIAADCELIVSELITNAVTHGSRIVPAADLPPVRLRLTRRTRGVRVEVWDPSDDMPRLRSDSLTEEPGGRGLLLVAGIASSWGAYRTEGGGKCVFAVLAS
jgi:anti-sigma regulatory factor (Ser/Thr protein kinase)